MNKQLLNVNTIYTLPNYKNQNIHLPLENANTDIDNEMKIDKINSIINRNNSTARYKILKYLGVGIRGNLYLATDNNNRRFICKQIQIQNTPKPVVSDDMRQIQFELEILKYLSSNHITREHINPCVENIIDANTIYTFFPVFNGYSLYRFHQYLLKMPSEDYYKILFFLIKSLFHALAKIHDTNIAHQNITTNSILVSTFDTPREIKIKLTDFALGCGMPAKFPKLISNALNKDGNGYTDVFYQISSCRENLKAPVKIDSSIISSLKDSDYLQIAQKSDILNLGLIIIRYLLYYEDINERLINMSPVALKRYLEEKILFSQNTRKQKINMDDKLPNTDVSIKTKQLILAYLKILNRFILVETNKRRSSQYILDKLIIYEKYKNDIF